MFSLSELVSLNQHQNRSKLLKPWWEVFMDYLVVLMLMASVLACTEQLSRDQVVCVPLDPLVPANASDRGSSTGNAVLTHVPHNVGPNGPSEARGRRTHLVHQQYVYVSQVCYHEALPLCSRFFPYMALLQSLVLVASGSFWLHFPRTCARIEHFLSILAKCCESPWTSQALSHAARQENLRDQEARRRTCRAPPPSVTGTRRSSVDSGTDSPPLRRPRVVADGPRQPVTLDKSDGEQARALFEKVRTFRSHCENSAVIYKVYLSQTVFKLLMVTLVVGYTVPFLGSLSFAHTCRPPGEPAALLGYSAFRCIHVLSPLLRKLLVAYLTLLGLYGLLSLYSLAWTLHSSLQRYAFCSLTDVPALRKDLAFLLHMLDQYDPLLAPRLSVFLSPVSESRLLEEELDRSWGEEKLRAMTRVGAGGRAGLRLAALPRLPPALFSLAELRVLRLELITDARFTAQVANMTSLRELHLCHCTAAVDAGALAVLRERLEVLHLTFTRPSEIPGWALSLRGLRELRLCGLLSGERGGGRDWALGGLRRLRALVIRGSLHGVSAELCEAAGGLARLEIYSEGTGLRRMVDLTELRLQGCRLERLPSALLALTRLRTLDLRHNDLRTVEEPPGLAHLRHLSCLRLACNRVLAVPAGVGALRGLELLDLSDNRIQNLPPALFALRRLRRLLLAGNVLAELPAEVKALQRLTELDLSGNRLENLPSDLFSGCLQLRVLNVAHNCLSSVPEGISALSHLCRLDLRSNRLEELPAELGLCSGLHAGGLLVEDWLFLSLPPHVRGRLSRSASRSRPESDGFPYFSPAQWRFSTALESQI